MSKVFVVILPDLPYVRVPLPELERMSRDELLNYVCMLQMQVEWRDEKIRDLDNVRSDACAERDLAVADNRSLSARTRLAV